MINPYAITWLKTLKIVDVPWQSKEILLSSVLCRDDVLTTFSCTTQRERKGLFQTYKN